MVVSLLITMVAWMLAPTEMPWWWALFPTAVTLVLLRWEGEVQKPKVPPLPPDPPPARRRLP